MRSRRISSVMRTLVAAALVTGSCVGSALAESACKGLEQRQCEGKAGCIWVDGYVRKDGVKVAAYCKSSGKSSDAATTEGKKAATKEKKSSTKE